ncbi:hypothetical protein [Eisenibacter elegans]|jgi:hypothetical protein|uniref:hypothetical protein n=1 Tax=Eisenibacter elegans TaxID=997 RepID=UPI00040E9FCA|nr:hypothetical protein [Eisenibacter elegans]
MKALSRYFSTTTQTTGKRPTVFWVIEPIADTSMGAVVKFYNTQKQLIHSELLPHISPNVLSEQTLKHLQKLKLQLSKTPNFVGC